MSSSFYYNSVNFIPRLRQRPLSPRRRATTSPSLSSTPYLASRSRGAKGTQTGRTGRRRRSLTRRPSAWPAAVTAAGGGGTDTAEATGVTAEAADEVVVVAASAAAALAADTTAEVSALTADIHSFNSIFAMMTKYIPSSLRNLSKEGAMLNKLQTDQTSKLEY